MTWDQVEGTWKQHKSRIKSKRVKQTDDDIEPINDKRTERLGLLQSRYGRAKDQAELEIDRWAENLD